MNEDSLKAENVWNQNICFYVKTGSGYRRHRAVFMSVPATLKQHEGKMALSGSICGFDATARNGSELSVFSLADVRFAEG